MHENRETSLTPAKNRRPARQGQGRKARMHVMEESDSGIVLMNYSNRDDHPLRRVGREGR
jgi:hypothetical protein